MEVGTRLEFPQGLWLAGTMPTCQGPSEPLLNIPKRPVETSNPLLRNITAQYSETRAPDQLNKQSSPGGNVTKAV